MSSPDVPDPLRKGWDRLLERYRVALADGAPVFDLLIEAYTAPERHYHNVEHLGEMFRAAARLATITDDPSTVQLAIWFHDAVYDTRAKDNEARSAELAVQLLGPIGVPRSELERVSQLIAMTAHLAQAQPPGDRETAILLDADLAILAAAEDRYLRYADAIRQEYSWVPDADYRAGRGGVLDHFLARPQIYWTEVGFQDWEDRARANLRAERETLR